MCNKIDKSSNIFDHVTQSGKKDRYEKKVLLICLFYFRFLFQV